MSANYRWALITLLLMAGCGTEPAATSEALSEALTDASSGDVVQVAEGDFSGEFTIPAGVTIEGSEEGLTRLMSDSGTALTLRTTAGTTTHLHGIEVHSSGNAGLALVGDGAVVLNDVKVEITRGIGIGAEGLASLEATDVQVIGPVNSENATDQPVNPTPADSATHGILLVDVADATFLRTTVRGLSLFGALSVNSISSWVDSSASDNLGTGFMAHGGAVSLNSMEVCRTFQGFRLPPVFGMVFTADVQVESQNLTVCETDGIGMLHAGSSGHHTDMVGSANAGGAVWIQESSGIAFDGDATTFVDNSFAGMVIIDSSNLSVDGAHIEGTRSVARTFGLTGRVEVGDGLQLVRSTEAISLVNVSLVANERAGMLLELGDGSTAGIQLQSITATGTGAELGVVAQSGTLASNWDDGVSRDETLALNDGAFFDAGLALDIVEVVTPTDLPQAAALADNGLSLVGVVTPTD